MGRHRTSLPNRILARAGAVGAALVGLAVVCAAAPAHAADPSLAVLGLEAVDVPEPLAAGLTDALRQRAAGTQGVRVVPAKDLIEIKLAFGCDENAASCMAQAGKSLSADKLLYGTVRKGKGGKFDVALRLLDVKGGFVERQVNDSVQKRDLQPGMVQITAAHMFGQLVQVSARPLLTVSSDPVGGIVEIDGQARGSTPVTIRDLMPGSHSVTVSVTGYTPQTRTVDLRAGGTFEVNVRLEKLPVEKPPVAVTTPPEPPKPAVVPEPTPTPATRPELVQTPPPAHPGRAAKIAGIAALGGAVIAGAVAIYTWRTYVGLEDTAHNSLVTAAQSGGGSQGNASFFQNPSCGNVPSGAVFDKLRADCSSGQTYANATTALWVVAGALAVGGVVAIVVGDRQSRNAERNRGNQAKLLRQSFRMAPVFSAQGGGLQAAFEF